MSSAELPVGWAEVPLSDVAEVRLGRQRSPSRAFGERMRPYLRAANVGWEGLKLDDVLEMAFTEQESVSYELRAGDLLLSEASGSPGEVGKPALWKGEIPGCCFQNTLIRVRPCEVLSEYLLYFFRAQALNGEFARGSRGVGIHHLGAAAMTHWPVRIPPLGEQRRIVEAIELAFSKLNAGMDYLIAAGRRLERLEETARWSSLLRVDHVSIDPAGLPVLPSHWSWQSLGSIADVAGGVTKDAKKQAEPGYVEVPYLRVANVQRGWLALDDVTTIRVAPERAKTLRLEPGDVLFNEGGDRDKLGRGWVWEGQIDNCIHQNHVFRARINVPGIQPKYVSLWGNTFGRRWFEQAGKQTTNLASISMTSLRAFPVPVPPPDEQVAIVAEIEAQESIISTSRSSIDHELRRAGALRRAVLATAFAGELVPQDSADEHTTVLLKRLSSRGPSEARQARTSRPRRVVEGVPG